MRFELSEAVLFSGWCNCVSFGGSKAGIPPVLELDLGHIPNSLSCLRVSEKDWPEVACAGSGGDAKALCDPGAHMPVRTRTRLRNYNDVAWSPAAGCRH